MTALRLCLVLALALCIPALAAPSPAPGPLVTTESGLQYRDIVVGKGAEAKAGMVVTVHYKGWLLHGRLFDSSYAKGVPLTFVLGDHQVIRGWDEGIATMRVGGKRRLIVPPALGYRDEVVGTIPPDSTLDFEVVLLDVKNPSTASPTP